MSAVGEVDHHVRIRPPKRWPGLGTAELWEYRELAYFLIKRELQVRYKQTIFGAAWAIVQPLALTAIFSLILGRLVEVPSEGVPYPLFALAGFVVWMFVSQAVSQAGGSLIADSNLLAKVYFPRLVVPLAKMGSLLIDLVIALVLLLVVALLYAEVPSATIVVLPAFLALALLTVAGIGILTSALNVRYRDVNAVLPLAVMMWLFITPVAYPASLVTGAWEYVYAVNPVATVITGTRWALLDTPAPDLASAAISVATAAIVFVVAVVYFRRSEHHFADVI